MFIFYVCGCAYDQNDAFYVLWMSWSYDGVWLHVWMIFYSFLLKDFSFYVIYVYYAQDHCDYFYHCDYCGSQDYIYYEYCGCHDYCFYYDCCILSIYSIPHIIIIILFPMVLIVKMVLMVLIVICLFINVGIFIEFEFSSMEHVLLRTLDL